jgi:hypothetical protein
MFTPWIKRKSLKKTSKSKRLVVDGEPPSLIALLSVSALVVVAGVFVVQTGMASSWWGLGGSGTPSHNHGPSYGTETTPTPSLTPTPTFSAAPIPTQGPSRRMY